MEKSATEINQTRVFTDDDIAEAIKHVVKIIKKHKEQTKNNKSDSI